MSIWYILLLTKEKSVLLIHLLSLFHSGGFSTERASIMVEAAEIMLRMCYWMQMLEKSE